MSIYQFSAKKMIPKIIHYVWLGGKQLPDALQNYIDGWKKLMPGYEFMEWNEHNFDLSVSKYATQALERHKYAFASDFIRVAVLKQYGGIYLDVDVEVLKPFDPLLGESLFLGFENEANICSAVIGCEPNHPFIQSLYDFYLKASFLKRGKENNTPNVMYLTYLLKRDYGLKISPVSQSLTRIGGNDKISVYSPEYFTPFNFNTRKEIITENSYAVHRFANSWAPKSLKTTQKFVNFLRKIMGRRLFGCGLRIYTGSSIRKAGKFINSFN